jgi:DNA-damage-inducible protein D
MEKENKVTFFETHTIRRVFEDGVLYFNLTDVIQALTNSTEPRKYWSKVKRKMTNTEGANEMSTIWRQLKFSGSDGKKYLMDAANRQGLMRILMSVPSPKVEPFRIWLSEIAEQHLEETENPELGFERLKELYQAKGYPAEWIESRLKSIGIRKELTDEWQKRGVVEGREYSVLTAEIAKSTFGLTPTEHKQLKGLDKHNLRDHMTNMELIFTMLGEESTRQLTVERDAQGFNENFDAATEGGNIAGDARLRVEARGRKVVSSENFLTLQASVTKELKEETDKSSESELE